MSDQPPKHEHDDCVMCLQRRVRELQTENDHLMSEIERLAREKAEMYVRLNAENASVTAFHKGNGI